MAGNKTVPLTWGEGGPRIGTATIDENGLVMGKVEDPDIRRLLFAETKSFSIFPPRSILDVFLGPGD